MCTRKEHSIGRLQIVTVDYGLPSAPNASKQRLLLTGFEPNDDGLNASQIVVESVAADLPWSCKSYGDRLRCAILPGDTNRLASTLCGLIDEHQTDVCLLVGQAPGRSRVTFERLATNLRDFMVPDRAGNLEAGTAVVPTAPAAYFSTLGALCLAQRLTTAGIPAAPSNHAGNHLCNQSLYLALHYSATSRPEMRVIFMHIPILPVQVESRWSDVPTMSLTMLRKAVAVTIQAALECATPAP